MHKFTPEQWKETRERVFPLWSRFGHHWNEVSKNLEIRDQLLRASDSRAEELVSACRIDPLFWLNFFCWTYDPRRRLRPCPMITYPFQEIAFYWILHAIDNQYDLLIEKSRDMGATWLVLYAAQWHWMFRPYSTSLLVSRKEDLVDKPDDPDCLFWKLIFNAELQPTWLLERFNRRELGLFNPLINSTIDGTSTTGDVARGGRREFIVLDEFAFVENQDAVLSATADAAQCRLFISTPNGSGNAFYRMRETDMPGLTLIWWLHPVKSKGLYIDESGKRRSPWYDRETKRRGSPKEIAQEIDLDYAASGSAFFDLDIVEQLQQEAIEPMEQGEFVQREDRWVFEPRANGRLRLWCRLRDGWPLFSGKAVAGCDIATGTGASNSCLALYDAVSKSKLAEWVCPNTSPEDFANVAVAICKWFNHAFLVWEANGGTGQQFGLQVQRLQYSNVYYKTGRFGMTAGPKDAPGWWSTIETKSLLMQMYRSALARGSIRNHSKEALEECRFYQYLPNGGVEHAAAVQGDDPSGARFNHGDRAMADALANLALEEVQYRGLAESQERRAPSYATYEGRRRLRQLEEADRI